MGFFGAAHGWGGGALAIMCHAYPTMKKLGIAMPHLMKTQKTI